MYTVNSAIPASTSDLNIIHDCTYKIRVIDVISDIASARIVYLRSRLFVIALRTPVDVMNAFSTRTQMLPYV